MARKSCPCSGTTTISAWRRARRAKLTARLATAALGGKKPVLEVGGWNIQTEYQCNDLKASKTELKAKEPLTVTAQIANTFLDGSRVTLFVDGQARRHQMGMGAGRQNRRGCVRCKFLRARRAYVGRRQSKH